MLFLADAPSRRGDQRALSLSRGSVDGPQGTGGWNLVQLRHVPATAAIITDAARRVGDLRALVEERKKREIDPTLTTLRADDEPASIPLDRFAQERMAAMRQIELLTDWYAEMRRLDNERLLQLLRLGERVVKALEFKDRMLGRGKGVSTSLDTNGALSTEADHGRA